MVHTLSLYEQLRYFHKTQEQFARDLGVSLATVSRWLRLRTKPSHLAQAKIEEVINDYIKERYKEEEAPNQEATQRYISSK